MIFDDACRNGNIAPCKILEYVDPRAGKTHRYVSGFGKIIRNDHFLGRIADTRSERFRNGLLRAPETDDRLRRVCRLRREFQLFRRKNAVSELLGKVARDRLDVHADLRVRGGERDYELRRMSDEELAIPMQAHWVLRYLL